MVKKIWQKCSVFLNFAKQKQNKEWEQRNRPLDTGAKIWNKSFKITQKSNRKKMRLLFSVFSFDEQ